MPNRLTDWVINQILTDTALDAEFDNVYTGTIDRTAGRWGANDDIATTFGSSQDCVIEYDTGQTSDCLLLGLNMSDGGILMLLDNADRATNFALAARTNPSLIIHSADGTTAADYIEFQHDQTNAVINAGVGDILLQQAGVTRWTFTANTIVAEGTGADDAFETTITVTNPTADRSVTIPDGDVTLTTGTSTVRTGTPVDNQIAFWTTATTLE